MIKFLILFAGVSLSTFGQNNSDILNKVKEHYNDLKTFSYSIDYLYYDTYTDNTYSEKMNSEYYKEGKKFRIEMDSITTISDGMHVLSIDKNLKQIIISNDIFESASQADPMSFLNTDNSLVLLKQDDLLWKFRYQPQSGAFPNVSKIDILVSKKTYLIEKLIFYYSAVPLEQENKTTFHNPRVEILYKNLKTATDLPDKLFNFQTYVIKNGESYFPQSEYKNYEIIKL